MILKTKPLPQTLKDKGEVEASTGSAVIKQQAKIVHFSDNL